MFKRTNYYVRRINGNKINLKEALEMFEIKYKKSLKFKYVSQGTGLDLIDILSKLSRFNRIIICIKFL